VGTVLDALTAPLGWAYAAGVRHRNRRFDRTGGTAIEGVRVVSVGNLAVGGTGKTPLAAWVARVLADGGLSVALVARGYGKDELMLHRRWNPDVRIVADPDRVAGVRRALTQGADVAVLDDGFQHRRLARDLDLVLLAAEDPYPARLLPGGPFREGPESLARAHAVVVTRRTATAEEARSVARRVGGEHARLTLAVAALLPGPWQDLQGRPADAPVGPTLSAAGVARPGAFAAQVAAASGNDTELVSYPDHHDYTESDARALRARAGARTLVVTEKDAVKLVALAPLVEPARVLTQALQWEAGENALKNLITSACTPGA
jgi:tetraacyldisaccharide 4'-kinase